MNNNLHNGTGIAVIITAAGSGSRMGSDIPKQFLSLGGVPILVRTLRRMREILPQASITIVLPQQYTELWSSICLQWGLCETHKVCTGSETRFESVKKAIDTLSSDFSLIAVHDGVRPFFGSRMVIQAIELASKSGAAIPVIEPVDSFRIVTKEGSSPLDRAALRAVQTPQIFRSDILRKAYAAPYDPRFTDDASVVERMGVKIEMCRGERQNIKITSPEDMLTASAWIGSGDNT